MERTGSKSTEILGEVTCPTCSVTCRYLYEGKVVYYKVLKNGEIMGVEREGEKPKEEEKPTTKEDGTTGGAG